MVETKDRLLNKFNTTYDNKVKKSSKAITSDLPNFEKDNVSQIKDSEQLNYVLNEVLQDEELRAFICILRDSIIRSGYKLIGSKSAIKSGEEIFETIRFRKKLKRIAMDLLIYKHAFVEIEKNDLKSKVINLHVLDPSVIRPVIDVHGKLLRWQMPNPKGIADDYIKWEPDEITHIVIDEMTPTFWGITDIETLKDIVRLKKLVMKHIELLFQQNWFRVHFHGKNVGEIDIDQFIEMFMTNMESPETPMITIGTEDMEGHKYVEETIVIPLIEILRELRNKMLTLLRVPPIIAGTVDNSNRSNSDTQAYFSFLNRVRAIQEDIEDDICFDLLPKLGMNNVKLQFNQNSNRELREMIDVSVLLINAGASKEKISKWMNEKGYDVPDDIFKLTPEEQKEKDDAMKPKLDKNSNLQESRKPQDNFNKDGFGTK